MCIYIHICKRVYITCKRVCMYVYAFGDKRQDKRVSFKILFFKNNNLRIILFWDKREYSVKKKREQQNGINYLIFFLLFGEIKKTIRGMTFIKIRGEVLGWKR